ncbi:transposase family protein [Litoribacterium kuwaitense]|uniref:transposase family protein n=1 Tax=Litoribacterium kuwaitense TaxID=1398745 RepID=UPI0035E464E0
MSVYDTSKSLDIVAFLPSSSARCPHCSITSSSRHSSYMRKIADLPVQSRSITIYLKTAK